MYLPMKLLIKNRNMSVSAEDDERLGNPLGRKRIRFLTQEQIGRYFPMEKQ